MSNSSSNTAIGSIFQAQRAVMDQGTAALEQGAEVQRTAQRLAIDGVEQVGPIQREGIDVTRRTVVGFVRALSRDGSDGPGEDIDEIFAQLEETHEDLFEQLERVLRESSESYDESLDDIIETFEAQVDEVKVAQRDLEATTDDAVEVRAETAENVADQTFDTAQVTMDATQEVTEETVDALEDAAEDATDAAADAADEAADTTERAADEITDSASDAADDAEDDLERTVGSVEETVESAADQFDTEVERFRAELDSEFDGLGETYADRIVDSGIESLDDLAEATAEDVAEAAQTSETQAQTWIDRADERRTEREDATERLADLEGIGQTYAERLQAAGIETEGELAQTSVEEVAEIAEVGEDRASEWINQAQNEA